MIKKGIKMEMALIDDAKSVDVNFNKYTLAAEGAALKASDSIDLAIRNLMQAMIEADKADKISQEIEKSAAALGIKPTDIPYNILVMEIGMSAGRWEELLNDLQSAKKSIQSSGII